MTMKTLCERKRFSSRQYKGGEGRGEENALSERVSHNDLPHSYDILMICRHERLNLPQTRDGESVLLLVHLELLERDDVTRCLAASAEDDAVGTFFDLVEALFGRSDRQHCSKSEDSLGRV
jgi:hypothetical protein